MLFLVAEHGDTFFAEGMKDWSLDEEYLQRKKRAIIITVVLNKE